MPIRAVNYKWFEGPKGFLDLKSGDWGANILDMLLWKKRPRRGQVETSQSLLTFSIV